MNAIDNIAKFAAMCYDLLKKGLTITGGSVTVSGTLTETNSGSIKTAVESLATTVNGAATALQVELVGSTGTPINITAGDINVQLSDTGANPDKTRIGDGTNTLRVNTDGSINNPIDEYCIASLDDTGGYYGYYHNNTSATLIKKVTTTDVTYYKGITSGYAADWTGRAGLTYTRANAIIW